MHTNLLVYLMILGSVSAGCAVAPAEADPTAAAWDELVQPPPPCAQAISADGSTTHHLSILAGAALQGGRFSNGLWLPLAVQDHLEVPLDVQNGDVIVSVVIDGQNSEGSLLSVKRSDSSGEASTDLGMLQDSTPASVHQSYSISLPHVTGAQKEVVGTDVTSYYLDIEASLGFQGGGTTAFGPILLKTAPAVLPPGTQPPSC